MDSGEAERLLRWNVLPAYRAGPLAATVVDAALGEPLAGVIVVAHREVESPYNGATVAQVIVMETTTDKQGKFAFPAWGLKRPHTSLAPLAVAPWTGRLRYQAPALLLFKSDYMPLTLANPTPGFPLDKGPLRHSYWNGKTIKLKPAGGDLKGYAKALAMFDGASVNFAFSIPDCSWKRIPRLILALDKEPQRLKTEGEDWGLSSLDHFDGRSKRYAETCGSLREFMRSYER